MAALEELFPGRVPPGLFRVAKTVGRAMHRFSMLEPDEPLLIGVSGGKDSLLLSLALSLRSNWVPVRNPLFAAIIEWEEFPLEHTSRDTLQAYFASLDIPRRIMRGSMGTDSSDGELSCYRCSRNRKRLLFEMAMSMGIRTVAFGHHMDDFIETTLINIALRGAVSSMQPVQSFFAGTIRVIRPLCLVKENTVRKIVAEAGIPVAHTTCPNKENNLRLAIKPIVRQLAHLDKRAREHLFNALYNIDPDFIKSPKTDA